MKRILLPQPQSLTFHMPFIMTLVLNLTGEITIKYVLKLDKLSLKACSLLLSDHSLKMENETEAEERSYTI